jgi:hypothetical protein
MENEFANLKSELVAITIWDRHFAELEHPDEIDKDAWVARFGRRQMIVQRLRELSANN